MLTNTLLCVSLMSAAGWIMVARPEPCGRAAHQPKKDVSRYPVSPRMSSDGLSAEFQRLVNQRSGTVFGHPAELLRERRVDSAWVLIFNAGEEDEGVYTLQGRDRLASGEEMDDCHSTYVLAFERSEEASRFSMLLQAQGFDMSTATEWGADQVSDFCAMAEFSLGFVPDDALLVPPQKNYFDVNAFEEIKEGEGAWSADSIALRDRLDKLLDL
mmetsp:Transcript_10397/g.21008  ORF Transcript_10397/g.21008 Transcript_10397/m.21008 type:complete len:214 (+) Transcript_10397:60-701(+)